MLIRLSNSPALWGELQRVKRRSAPVLSLGQGGALSLCLSLPQKNQGGWRADKAHGLDCSRPAREFRGSRASPDTPGPGVKRHPRASQRATEHLRAYALPTARTAQELSVPAGLFRASPVGEVASALPAGALPLPAFKTPHECAPRRVDRDGLSIITLQVKSRTISLMVNDVCVIYGHLTYVRA